MEGKELKTAIGTINLDSIEFGEILIDMFFDIQSIPTDIQEKINAAMESAKAEQLQKMKEYCTDKELSWSEEGINTESLLHISIDSNKGFSSWIEADATDKKNDMMWACASVEADLTEYMAELRPFIVRAAIEKFDEMRSMETDKEGL